MNRSNPIDELDAHFRDLNKNDADFSVNTILEALRDALVAGRRTEIRGLGSFPVNQCPARIGRNPRNGDSVTVPDRRVVHFKPAKALRESVDEGGWP